ncbi:rubrerythrin family protein [Synergistaceae bacterium OttesenSCG-928-I11]|nr:rubrerythrin family protein [Synergistaceae bacterium OttesenSCG-928-I11]
MSKTKENLMGGFAGESQANRKYTAFADVAEKEGHKDIARLFRCTADAENIHAVLELKLAGKVGDTSANLQAAIEGETYEFAEMYPEFEKDAIAEGEKEATRVFQYAKEAEKVHAKLYKEALDNLDEETGVDYYLCPVCGYIQKKNAPDNCPVCKAKGSVFKKY